MTADGAMALSDDGDRRRSMTELMTRSHGTLSRRIAERIYTKIGASTRSAATLFAVQHGLLGPSLIEG
jgi:hypothetical protein